MKHLALLITGLMLCSCATKPLQYKPPDSARLNASTRHVAIAVDKATTHAREAKANLGEAAKIATWVAAETKKLKDVPPSIVQGQIDLANKLNETSQKQWELEKDLNEAQKAKSEVERDKVVYFEQAQKLAETATYERSQRIEAEKKLSWYRWNSWLLKIGGAVVVLFIIVVVFLWLTGRLAGLASKFL